MIPFVSIQGFKSFSGVEYFPLRNLNVLIGPNRSGKTNFLDFWDLLSQTGKQQLSQGINRRGGIGSVLSWNQEITLKFELRFAKQDVFSQNEELIYTSEITRQHQSFSVTKERLVVPPEKKGSRMVGPELVDISSGKGWIYNSLTKNKQPQRGKIVDTELAIAQVRDALAYPILDKLRRYLSNITVHRPFNTEHDAPIRNSQPVGFSEAEIPTTRLSRGGDNLTNVLYIMQNEPRHQEYYEEYLTTLQRAFPTCEKLFFPADAGQGKTILAWQDRNFSKRAITANLLSDGTLRFMCLLAALYDPEPPSLICIDEPEIGLHPQLLRLLASVLQEASERMQIIVATHSSDLISFLENPEDVVVAEAEDGWSTLKRLSQKELQHWLEEYSLGELWKSGEIGGRS